MFPVSDFLREIIQSDDRSFLWNGIITFADGTVTNFDMENIIQSSGSLRGSCNYPGIGEAIATELSMQMYLDIDVEMLKNAVIQLNCQVLSDVNIDTWGGASSYSWLDLSGVKWGASPKTITANIPMGVYNVVKAKRKTLGITITAYDNMQKLDVEFKELDTVARTPYNWLSYCCDKCGIAFGMTNEEVKRFPNGSRLMAYANVNNDLKTYRNLVQRIASALCAVAVMDRYGRLKLVPCVSEPVLNFTPSDRFSSEFEDYKSIITGIYLQHKPSGIQKYYTNADDEEDDTGTIIDLGANPFLQSSNDAVRDASVQAIVDEFKDFEITPFEMDVPFDPTVELMDVVGFTGSHAPNDALAPITDFAFRINGDMNLRCDASETSANLLRADKNIEGSSGEASGDIASYGNTGFWLNAISYPSESKSITGETDTTALGVELSIENSRVQIAWTGTYSLIDDATVTARVYVDTKLVYTVSDKQTAGKHTLSLTTGYDITGKGNYKFKVSLTTSSGTLTVSPDSIRLTVLGFGWYGTITSGTSWTEWGQILKDIADLLEYEYPADTNWDDIAGDYEFDEFYVDADGTYISEEDFNYASETFKNNNWNRKSPNPKRYNYKTKNNKSYVNTNQEGNDSIPYSIKVDTQPNRYMYAVGETLDIEGMVVKAYDVAGDLWTSAQYPEGIIPNSELTLVPDKAPQHGEETDGNNND